MMIICIALTDSNLEILSRNTFCFLSILKCFLSAAQIRGAIGWAKPMCLEAGAGADNRTDTLRADPPTDQPFNG